MITIEQLIKLGATRNNAIKYVSALNDTCVKYKINTNARLSHFLAQIFVESACLNRTKESLSYTAKRLMEVWPKRFPDVESTNGYAMNPVALAEKVYGGRMGNNQPGDGGKYLGRGLKQLTGKNNYQACSKALGVDFVSHPELLEQPLYACLSAGFFWDSIKANNVADIDKEQTVKTITKMINGGLTGLDERVKYWKKAKEIFK